jgi:hypothetical protein
MMIVTQDLEAQIYDVFDARRAPELDVRRVSSWLHREGVPHDVRRLRTTIRRDVLLDDEGQLTSAALGLATFLASRDEEELSGAYLERLRLAIAAHPEGIEHVRGLIVIPASA